jgi:hypothetical protein
MWVPLARADRATVIVKVAMLATTPPGASSVIG